MKTDLKWGDEKGFTLTELMTYVAMAGITFLGLFLAYEKLSGVYTSVLRSSDVIQYAHTASDFMDRECSNVKDKNSIFIATSTEFKFTNTPGTLVDLTYANSQLKKNTVMFADHVTACTFTYYKWDGTAWTSGATNQIAKLRATFTVASGSYTYSSDETVLLRNMR